MSNEEKRIVAETIDKLKQLPEDMQRAVYYTATGMVMANAANKAQQAGAGDDTKSA